MTTTDALCDLLIRRQPLDPAILTEEDRRAAVAAVLDRTGALVRPASRSARSVLQALADLERLAGLAVGSVRRPWLALRAMDLAAGEAVGGALVADPVALALIAAGGGVATAVEDDRVGGAIGGLGSRRPETLTARARIVDPGDGVRAFTVESTDGVLFSAPANADLGAVLAGIDALPRRRAAAAAAVGPSVPLLSYEVVPHERAALTGDNLFEEYAPALLRVPGAQRHPSPLVESAALASVLPPMPVYRPALDTALVTSGALSDVQLEAVVYAGQAHGQYLPSDPMDPNGAAPRQGILLGHGTGTGKGTMGAGIIRDNFNQGRRRAVWISESNRLHSDAVRDWVRVGGRPSDVFALNDFSIDQDLPQRNGILFLTYALLRGTSGRRSRVDQIIDWLGASFDGVILIDESQNLRHAVVRGNWRDNSKRSKQGRCAMDLQGALPNARVVYMSATSASDIAGLGYASRLGLWGRGTAFPTAQAFFEQMDNGGLNALELCARDMKSQGVYLCANLSFRGVTYDRLEYRLTAEERALQDRLATTWSRVNGLLREALRTTGVTKLTDNAGASVTARTMSHFLQARSRFFQALLSSIKAKAVIEAVRQDMRDGHASIIQLTNTYEANADRAIADNGDGDLAEVEASPRTILLDYLRDRFPTVRHQTRVIDGKHVAVPVIDPKTGQPQVCPRAVAQRDALIADLQALTMPEGPLEQLFQAFGPEQIAEVTGRQHRLVPGPTPGSRILEDRSPAMVVEDIRQFQSDLKRILVFSTTGAAGASYDANFMVLNQRLRRHYLLQAGWRSDMALQGLGRSHRSGEVQPPEYILVTADLWADKRMISVVAAGMGALGAITRGMRTAASEDLFGEEDNLENALARDAWIRFLRDLEASKVVGLSLPIFEYETGIPLTCQKTGRLERVLPELRRFLNAMGGMTCNHQEVFGTAYRARLDEMRLEAIRNGSFDRGIETLTAQSLIKLEDTVIHRDARTGAPTRLLRMLRIDPVKPTSYADAEWHAIKAGNSRFVKSLLTNRIALLMFPRLRSDQMPSPDDTVSQLTPAGMRERRRADVVNEKWVLVSAHEARSLWDAELATTQVDVETEFHVVAGTLLPLWDRMPKRKAVVYRMMTDEGEHILGRVLPPEWVEKFVQRVGAGGGGSIPAQEALARVEAGETATLANGWAVEGRRNPRTGGTTIELFCDGDVPEQHRTALEAEGVLVHPSPWNNGLRFLLPDDPAQRGKVWQNLVRHRPVIGLTALWGEQAAA